MSLDQFLNSERTFDRLISEIRPLVTGKLRYLDSQYPGDRKFGWVIDEAGKNFMTADIKRCLLLVEEYNGKDS